MQHGPYSNFNPRTREGCDDGTTVAEVAAYNISIHAPVKGATAVRRNAKGHTADFNPRTREGCDFLYGGVTIGYHRISIHAPVKGATLLDHLGKHGIVRISIHAPVKGATTHI